MQLLQELSLASDEALAMIKELPNLIPALSGIAHPATGLLGRLRGRIGRSLGNVASGVGGGERADAARRAEALVAAAAVSGASKVSVRSNRFKGLLGEVCQRRGAGADSVAAFLLVSEGVIVGGELIEKSVLRKTRVSFVRVDNVQCR